jgi:hypothetical protein
VTDHPSFFALDLHALGAAHEPHLVDCAECQAYLAAREVPPMSHALRERASAPRFRWAWPALTFAASAAAIVLWATPPELTSKAAPAVAVYVKRSDVVAKWNGGPLRVGDALQLELASEGYAYEAVAGEHVFYRGATSARAHAVPLSLVVDDAPGDETVSVVFSRHALSDDTLLAAAAAHTRTREVWVTSFTFAKELP